MPAKVSGGLRDQPKGGHGRHLVTRILPNRLKVPIWDFCDVRHLACCPLPPSRVAPVGPDVSAAFYSGDVLAALHHRDIHDQT